MQIKQIRHVTCHIWQPLLLGIILALGCSDNSESTDIAEEEPVLPAPTLIQRMGTYDLGDGVQLKVWPGGDPLAFYQLGDPNDVGTITWQTLGDMGEPWVFHWDEEKTLWGYSEQLGVFGHDRKADGNWNRFEIPEDQLDRVPEIPATFFSALPETLQAKWAWKRDSESAGDASSAESKL